MFVRKGIDVKGVGEIWVYKEPGYIPEGDIGFHPRNLQYAHITYKESEYIVCNFHGFWNGKGKTDCDERIEQSERIAAFLEPYSEKTVIIGDFNLLPDTESIAILERAGYRNLVSEYGVTSTRTSLYSKSEKFADYAFVGSGITVKDFKILPDEVSDHAPLLLEFA
jgi:endonuclease/exonuclease/phosphatase family metal-dependent hydrolase